MNTNWTYGNVLNLLENGEAFFPRVNEAIARAQTEVLLETFILFDDKVGQALRQALIQASERGVRVDILVDGFGSAELPPEFIDGLTLAGVGFHIFDPGTRVFGMRTNLVRRLHRKLIVIDGATAFVGGINFGVDHLAEFGPLAKQDYAVEIEGPLVRDIHLFMRQALAPINKRRLRWPYSARARSADQERPGQSAAALVVRDNRHHRTDIEQHYRLAIRQAKSEIIIANAYFFPGYRLLRELRRAAKRGVRVRLILQGEPDMPIAKLAARTLYDYLLSAGVEIHEYCRRPLHGKVALADDQWATVGSSNLEPLSLALNLEANVVVRDAGFTAVLRERLLALIEHDCRQIKPNQRPSRKIYRTLVGVLVFHFLRRFPLWATALPMHKAQLSSAAPPELPPCRPEADAAASGQRGERGDVREAADARKSA